MKKAAFLAPLVTLFLACGSSSPGYLNTDVLEPQGLGAVSPTGVKMTGQVMTEGTLTAQGAGEVQKVYIAYVDAMRGLGWEPRSADGDPNKGMQCSLRKDTRQVDITITPEGQGAVKMIIKVGASR